MRFLILVFAVSILVLLCAAWAIAQAIRKHGNRLVDSATSSKQSEPDVSEDKSEEQ